MPKTAIQNDVNEKDHGFNYDWSDKWEHQLDAAIKYIFHLKF